MAGSATEGSSLRGPAPKRYVCHYEGCGKAFTRSGHLLRHSQNHTDITWACDRCEASFKREDLLERHKSRHGIKDKRAGGTGLGRLITKKHHRQHNVRQKLELPETDNNFSLTGSPEDRVLTTPGTNQYPDIFGGSLHSMVQQDLSQIPTPPRDDLCVTATESGYIDFGNDDIEDFINSLAMLEQQSHVAFDPFRTEWPATRQQGQPLASRESSANFSMNIDPMLQGPVDSFAYTEFSQANGYPNHSNQAAQAAASSSTRLSRHESVFRLPAEVREGIIRLILETHPVTPSGTAISMNTPELSLESMQDSLDLFASHFNTSYPLIHVATFDIGRVDHVLLLSMLLLGSTYKNKQTHQFSVCLYDALIPHVFGGLSNNTSPELHRLQSLLLLDCYGMYRAGPSQRSNALLLHRVLLSSISIMSRYHVKAKIGLPAEMVMSAEQNFSDFAYAEQLKRVILLFFMWDVQNASFFSVTPSLSIDEIDIAMPCSTSSWSAINEAEWKMSHLNDERPEALASAVKFYLDDGADVLPPREDMLTLTLSLHGLMSISNGMRRSSKLHTFHDILDLVEASSSTWRTRMCTALECWKARFDAFAMDSIHELESEILHCDFQRDSMGVFAIYRAAYIVVNVEVRHLQIAAGAATIFGHPVEESDYATSTEWIKKWATDSTEAVGRAAWQSGQMFREGMLNLKEWYVHDVFHYPWCLYLATLTCWAANHFSMLPLPRREPSIHISPLHSGPPGDSRKEMNRLVAMIASTNPSNMVRLIKKCNTKGLVKEMAKYLRTVRWAAAHEAMIVLEGLSTQQE